FLFSSLLQAALTDVILISSVLVRKVSQLHRLNGTIDDHGSTETGSQPQKQHLAALVAAQSLHGGIIDHLDRAFERGLEIKSYPTAPEIMRFHKRPIPDDHSRVANGYRLILPVPGEFFNSSDHPLRRHCRPRRKLPRLRLPGGKDLYVGSADIDGEYIHNEASLFKPKSEARNPKQTRGPRVGCRGGRKVTRHPTLVPRHSLTRLGKGRAFGSDHTHQLVPGGDERLRPFFLKLGGQGTDVDTSLGELIQYRLALAAVGRHDFADFSVIGQRFEGAFGHGIDRERRRKRFDVEHVGSFGVLGSRAGPQQPLRTSAGVVDTLPAWRAQEGGVRPVNTIGNSDAELIAQGVRHLASHRDVPTADKHGRNRSDVGLEPGLYAPLDAAQEGLGGSNVLLARK